MENRELMFDGDSFQDEITNASEAKSCYNYFTSNLTGFRHQLAESGLSYEEVENRVRQCWMNLVESSKKVGYSNGHLTRMAEKYKKGKK